jgi:hypothetical protein
VGFGGRGDFARLPGIEGLEARVIRGNRLETGNEGDVFGVGDMGRAGERDIERRFAILCLSGSARI